MNTKQNQLIIGGIAAVALVAGLAFFATRDNEETLVVEENIEVTDTTSKESGDTTNVTAEEEVVVTGGVDTTTQTQNAQTQTAQTSQVSQTTQKPATGNPPPDEDVYELVTYTDAGFSPRSLTAKVGDTVFFWNKSSERMWISSNVSLCAEDVANLFDTCGDIAIGNGWTYTFNESGSFTYNDNNRPSNTGTIIVE
ncbi:MAG: hypothetical protein WDZ90_01585 [Candidatus Paceibacterota bacterium]